MEEETVKIEYKKFSSFLKDCIKNFCRGYLFFVSDEEYSLGETFSFSIEAADLEKPLTANGKVIFVGENGMKEKGAGLEFSFDEESRDFVEKKMKETVIRKYGDFWGTKLSVLLKRQEILK